jgi:hypothetical protein
VTVIRCDGCGMDFGIPGGERDPAIAGQRSDGFCGGGMPDGEFHWCRECGKAAVAAVRGRAAAVDRQAADRWQAVGYAAARSGPTPI